MREKLRILPAVLAIILLIVASTGCSDQTSGSGNAINIKTAVANKQKLQTTIDIAGVLVPAKTVNIASKISGQVTGLNFDVGSSVKEGDILITLETRTLDAQLQQAQAALQSAEAAVQAAKDQADQARINLDAAQKAYTRIKALYDSSAASQSQLDDVSSKLELAKKQYEIAVGSAQKQAQASVNTAKANINNIKVQLDNAIITSPISGVITNRNINPGEVASPGVVLLTIADTSTLKLKGTVPQQSVPMLHVNQKLDVTVDIFPNRIFEGTIERIGPMAVSTGEYFPVEISIKNPGELKAGLSARASVDVSSSEGVVIPASAVVQSNGLSYVYVIKNNVAFKRTVALGLKNDSEIEVLKGLDAGEIVAITNVGSLFDNMPVNVY
ncbi:MAG: efflux RND transporter periplasmic adaptor subunit [Tepidanaerobacteraceae bacterium]|jgi:RND family efflux transporter MFP subunit|nr:efflux RND transporter periplasmic adaptor subunit [Tepidanaerobacteraceae bacterium]